MDPLGFLPVILRSSKSYCQVAAVSGDVLPQELPHQIGDHTPVFL